MKSLNQTRKKQPITNTKYVPRSNGRIQNLALALEQAIGTNSKNLNESQPSFKAEKNSNICRQERVSSSLYENKEDQIQTINNINDFVLNTPTGIKEFETLPTLEKMFGSPLHSKNKNFQIPVADLDEKYRYSRFELEDSPRSETAESNTSYPSSESSVSTRYDPAVKMGFSGMRRSYTANETIQPPIALSSSPNKTHEPLRRGRNNTAKMEEIIRQARSKSRGRPPPVPRKSSPAISEQNERRGRLISNNIPTNSTTNSKPGKPPPPVPPRSRSRVSRRELQPSTTRSKSMSATNRKPLPPTPSKPVHLLWQHPKSTCEPAAVDISQENSTVKPLQRSSSSTRIDGLASGAKQPLLPISAAKKLSYYNEKLSLQIAKKDVNGHNPPQNKPPTVGKNRPSLPGKPKLLRGRSFSIESRTTSPNIPGPGESQPFFNKGGFRPGSNTPPLPSSAASKVKKIVSNGTVTPKPRIFYSKPPSASPSPLAEKARVVSTPSHVNYLLSRALLSQEDEKEGDEIIKLKSGPNTNLNLNDQQNSKDDSKLPETVNIDKVMLTNELNYKKDEIVNSVDKLLGNDQETTIQDIQMLTKSDDDPNFKETIHNDKNIPEVNSTALINTSNVTQMSDSSGAKSPKLTQKRGLTNLRRTHTISGVLQKKIPNSIPNVTSKTTESEIVQLKRSSSFAQSRKLLMKQFNCDHIIGSPKPKGESLTTNETSKPEIISPPQSPQNNVIELNTHKYSKIARIETSLRSGFNLFSEQAISSDSDSEDETITSASLLLKGKIQPSSISHSLTEPFNNLEQINQDQLPNYTMSPNSSQSNPINTSKPSKTIKIDPPVNSNDVTLNRIKSPQISKTKKKDELNENFSFGPKNRRNSVAELKEQFSKPSFILENPKVKGKSHGNPNFRDRRFKRGFKLKDNNDDDDGDDDDDDNEEVQHISICKNFVKKKPVTPTKSGLSADEIKARVLKPGFSEKNSVQGKDDAILEKTNANTSFQLPVGQVQKPQEIKPITSDLKECPQLNLPSSSVNIKEPLLIPTPQVIDIPPEKQQSSDLIQTTAAVSPTTSGIKPVQNSFSNEIPSFHNDIPKNFRISKVVKNKLAEALFGIPTPVENEPPVDIPVNQTPVRIDSAVNVAASQTPTNIDPAVDVQVNQTRGRKNPYISSHDIMGKSSIHTEVKNKLAEALFGVQTPVKIDSAVDMPVNQSRSRKNSYETSSSITNHTEVKNKLAEALFGVQTPVKIDSVVDIPANQAPVDINSAVDMPVNQTRSRKNSYETSSTISNHDMMRISPNNTGATWYGSKISLETATTVEYATSSNINVSNKQVKSLELPSIQDETFNYNEPVNVSTPAVSPNMNTYDETFQLTGVVSDFNFDNIVSSVNTTNNTSTNNSTLENSADISVDDNKSIKSTDPLVTQQNIKRALDGFFNKTEIKPTQTKTNTSITIKLHKHSSSKNSPKSYRHHHSRGRRRSIEAPSFRSRNTSSINVSGLIRMPNSSRLQIDDSRFIFKSDDELPTPGKYKGFKKYYPTGTGTNVPIKFSHFSLNE